MKNGVKKFVNRLSAIFESKITCTRCHGSGKIQCSLCGGSGRGMGPCVRCNGRGEENRVPFKQKPGGTPLKTYSSHDPGPLMRCTTCNGHGRSRCASCLEAGAVDCILCSGTGKINDHHGPGQDES